MHRLLPAQYAAHMPLAQIHNSNLRELPEHATLPLRPFIIRVRHVSILFMQDRFGLLSQ
jgi:hypothetical protein